MRRWGGSPARQRRVIYQRAHAKRIEHNLKENDPSYHYEERP